MSGRPLSNVGISSHEQDFAGTADCWASYGSNVSKNSDVGVSYLGLDNFSCSMIRTNVLVE